MVDTVTICIPTWQAEGFIDRTLRCAREQDYPDCQILVSVDKCHDRTADICRMHQAEDRRIRVIEHPVQLGWAANTNYLLDQVDTPYYALYFHDDRVEPAWISTLLKALQARPDAGAAFCCVRQNSIADIGEDHDGDAFERLIRRAVGSKKGSPLRALTRRGDRRIRFPDVSRLGYHAQHAYLVDLLASARMIYVPEALYHRWSGRDGGVTHQWKTMAPSEIEMDIRRVAQSIEATLSWSIADAGNREMARYAIELLLRQQVIGDEIRNGYRLSLSQTDIFRSTLRADLRERLRTDAPGFYASLCDLEMRVQALVQKRGSH